MEHGAAPGKASDDLYTGAFRKIGIDLSPRVLILADDYRLAVLPKHKYIATRILKEILLGREVEVRVC